MSECTEKLKINPALRLLVLPLSTAEYTALETDILTNGSQKPVQCWHSYIISDFERVEICRRHKISFDVYKTNFYPKSKSWHKSASANCLSVSCLPICAAI